MPTLIRKNLTRRKDFMVLVIFVLVAVLILSLRFREKIFDSKTQGAIIDSLRKYAGSLENLF